MNYSGGPNVIMWVLIRERQEVQSQREGDMITEAELRMMPLLEESYEPSLTAVSSIWKR